MGCDARGKAASQRCEAASLWRLVQLTLGGGVRDRPPRHDVGLSSWSRTSGAAAKVEKKVEKKPNHEAWKARMCGLEKLKMGMAVALCSASTGTEKRRPKISIVPLLLTPLRSKHSCSEAISALADCACACRSSTSSLSSVTSFAADIATRFHRATKLGEMQSQICQTF